MLIYLINRCRYTIRRKYDQIELPEWIFQFSTYIAEALGHQKFTYNTQGSTELILILKTSLQHNIKHKVPLMNS
jgi:hypothetical protein